jgi:hypothetical protein
MISVNQVLVISPEKEHHEKINVAMNKCSWSSISCKKFEEARIFMSTQKFGVVFCHDALPDGDFCSVVSAAKTHSSRHVIAFRRMGSLPCRSPRRSLRLHRMPA